MFESWQVWKMPKRLWSTRKSGCESHARKSVSTEKLDIWVIEQKKEKLTENLLMQPLTQWDLNAEKQHSPQNEFAALPSSEKKIVDWKSRDLEVKIVWGKSRDMLRN